MAEKNEYKIKPNRQVRLPEKLELWLIKKAKPTQNSVPAVIRDLLWERYQAEQKAA